MKRISGIFIAALLLTSSAHAAPVVLHFQGSADSGQLRGFEITGFPYDLEIFGDTTERAVPLNDFFNRRAEIKILGRDSLGNDIGGLVFVVPLLEQISPFFGGGDALKVVIIGNNFIFLPPNTLPDPEFILPFGPVLTVGAPAGSSPNGFVGISFFVEGGMGQPHVLDLSDADTAGSRINVFATTSVPESGSVWGFLVTSCVVLEAFRRRMRRRS